MNDFLCNFTMPYLMYDYCNSKFTFKLSFILSQSTCKRLASIKRTPRSVFLPLSF